MALAESDVGPSAKLVNETRYAGARELARDAEGWASQERIAEWGFVAGIGRVLDDGNGTRVASSVYVFREDRGARAAFDAAQEPFEAPGSAWTSVPARRVGDASGLWSHELPEGTFYVLNLATGDALAQVLATAPDVTAERALAWGDRIVARASKSS